MKRIVLLGSIFGLGLYSNVSTSAQDGTLKLTASQSILEDPQEFIVSIENSSELPPARIPTDDRKIQPVLEGDAELVQQRYPNGSPQVTKHVALDAEGNYVNHGEYQEWTQGGELKVHGRYEMGVQDGVWVRICESREAKLFESEPYKKFKGPFQSIAEFTNGKMNGMWTITDKDGKKVSEISLLNGRRHGPAQWYFPSGSILWQSEYKDGLLDGPFIEKDEAGTATRQTEFVSGQQAEKKTEYYSNKTPRMEYQILTALQTVLTLDDWDRSQLATYDTKGEEVKHGSYITYYENGSIRSQATMKNGVQEGEFVSWFPNNQRESTGNYKNGKQHGKWSWWHENGMRKAMATYEDGVLVGNALAWNDQGMRATAGELVQANGVPTAQPSPAVGGMPRSAAVSKRPGNK